MAKIEKKKPIIFTLNSWFKTENRMCWIFIYNPQFINLYKSPIMNKSVYPMLYNTRWWVLNPKSSNLCIRTWRNNGCIPQVGASITQVNVPQLYPLAWKQFAALQQHCHIRCRSSPYVFELYVANLPIWFLHAHVSLVARTLSLNHY